MNTIGFPISTNGSPMTEPTPILDSYEAYGCRVNAIGVDELFRKYDEEGFIYPAKRKALAPYWDQVKANWRAAMRGGELIHWVATSDSDDAHAWATISSWRSTSAGWVTQHLLSTGNPLISRSVMLGAQAVRIRDQFDRSHQNWFQPGKRMPSKVFGSVVQTLGEENAAVHTLNYMAQGPIFLEPAGDQVAIEGWSERTRAEFKQLAVDVRGRVYALAEDLDQRDGLLEGVDDLYRKVGLRRYRRMWLAYARGHDAPVAGIIAYRGPLGFNFSFLENRCDLLARPEVDNELAFEAIQGLLAAAWPSYEDCPLPQMLITCDDRSRLMLEKLGGRFIRQYAQSIWLRKGFVGYYRHVDKFYDRVLKAKRRRGLGQRMTCGIGGPRI